MAQALLAIGSNLGQRGQQLDAAVDRLRAVPGIVVEAVSRWHETAPIGGPPGQGAFLNGALRVETSLAPEALRQALARVELQSGRQRGARWEARVLDLDLLLYDDLVLSTPELVVPHPRMAFRRFVLEPAREVAPGWVHPQIGWTLERLVRHLNETRPYLALIGLPGVGKTRLAEQLAECFGGHAILLPAALAAAGKSAGPSVAGQIEFLHGLAECLSAAQFPPAERLMVSDFCFEQSLAYAEVQLPPGELPVFRAALDRLAPSIIVPRLRVMLTAAATPAEEHERHRIEDALSRVAAGPRLGPVLRLASDNLELVLTETRAAIEAMR
jgi:2-amino-4-hydroxy-6-hydroxymethyldihydropteridine diphosphokinase